MKEALETIKTGLIYIMLPFLGLAAFAAGIWGLIHFLHWMVRTFPL